MAEYATLLSTVASVITGAGLVAAPHITEPEDIPGRGAGSWVTIAARVSSPSGADGTMISIDRHVVELGMAVLTSFDRNLAQRSAYDLGLLLRESFTTPGALTDAAAQVTTTRIDIEPDDGGGRLFVRVTIEAMQTVDTTV